MVSTRSTRHSRTKQNHTSQDEDQSSCHIPTELQIHGTALLRGGKAASRGEVRLWRGARYEVSDDGVSWRTTKKRPASDRSIDSSTPAKKRVCRRETSVRHVSCSSASSQKRGCKRRRDNANHAVKDVNFLKETIQNFKKAKVACKSSRQAELRMMLPYLKKLDAVPRSRIQTTWPLQQRKTGDTPDAYELDDVAARNLLRSTENVGAPVFMKEHRMPLVDLESEPDRRPIEQIFDWWDLDETHLAPDLEKPAGEDGTIPDKRVPTADIRDRFLNSDQQQTYPWNFPDMPVPAAAESMPALLKHPNCNMMQEILRLLLNIEIEDICQQTCPNHGTTAERCKQHMLTIEEYHAISQISRSWLGTIMLGEAGAVTMPHCDTYGFGTYICIAEGEVGFAWSPGTTARKQGVSISDHWLFKVLRAGDAVCMDPGRYHLVFRLPGGSQTLGWAPRVLRYCDIERWLQNISVEVQNAVDGTVPIGDSVLIWRGLLIGAGHLIDQAKRRGDFGKFGSEQTVRNAEKLLKKVRKQLQKIV